MKGIIPICLMEMVITKFGDDKLDHILNQANIYNKNYLQFLPIEDVPDTDVLNIFNATAVVLNVPLKQVADEFGEYFCVTYAKKIYAPYFDNVKGAKDFLMKMENIHDRVTRSMLNASPPHFEYIDKAPDRLLMKYFSPRNLQPIWLGCIKGVGIAFNEKLDINVIDDNTVEIVFLGKIET